MYARRSARVLLVDGQDRLLLLGNRFGHGDVWLTPGGGLRRWERLSSAAARELAEEVGLTVDRRELGGPVAFTTGYADLSFAKGTFRDDFFFHRVDHHEIDTSRMEDLERGFHTGHRWWTLPDLRSTTETVYPFGLPPLLTDLLSGHIPPQPVQLPWHH
ncbi:NUDIX domain-containing protein [Actinoplanes sp. NBRC 103695]|uniref:NUDIX hydrolase n=1 Tax=Actinoplanes sp. NBRC 103695 TaxID=3032202 RepID=UPI0024A191AF|nr:NUDIX domain-containing protein [Actinoplanes sp. NBRC 103695]GLY98311.1 DNA mismatch repair protein MutT [Actinoplanes sp. NBRC 103695]